MDITLPLGSWNHGMSELTKTMAVTGHTEADPYLVIFKRKPHNGDTYGYQVKLVRSHENVDTSEKKNQLITIDFRNIDYQGVTNAEAAFDVLAAVLADPDLKAAALWNGRLPNDP